MKIPEDSVRVLTTEDVKGIVFARRAAGEAVSALAWDAWLVERDREAFDRGVAWQADYEKTIREVWPTH